MAPMCPSVRKIRWNTNPFVMSKIHFLPVRYGDCFVIECDKDGHHGIVVVDGGPKGGGAKLTAKLLEVGTPDLMMLTHYDDDHIKGLLQYFERCNETGRMPAREVWGNCIRGSKSYGFSL